MALITMAEQSAPATPSAGNGRLYFDTLSSLLFSKDDAGNCHGQVLRAALASQGAGFGSDTYVTNSGLIVPGFGHQAGMVYRWMISASKTGAGVAAPVYTIRIWPKQSTADTARLALTGPAQTAVADIGTLFILATVRNVGAAGVIQGTAWWAHRGTAANTTTQGVGFANDGTGHVEGASAAFDNSALGGQFVGLSINGGASAAWTVTQVFGECVC